MSRERSNRSILKGSNHYLSWDDMKLYENEDYTRTTIDNKLISCWNCQTRYLMYNIFRWIVVILLVLFFNMYLKYLANIDENTKYCCDCYHILNNSSLVNGQEYKIHWNDCIKSGCSCGYCQKSSFPNNSTCMNSNDDNNGICPENLIIMKPFAIFSNNSQWNNWQMLSVYTTFLYTLLMIYYTIKRCYNTSIQQSWNGIVQISLELTVYNIVCTVFCHYELFMRFVYHRQNIETINNITIKCLASTVPYSPLLNTSMRFVVIYCHL